MATDFAGQLRLKGMAEEDVYFAKRDRELIEALRHKKLNKQVDCSDADGKKQAKKYEQKFSKISDKLAEKPKKRVAAYRKLIDEILEACKHRKKSKD